MMWSIVEVKYRYFLCVIEINEVGSDINNNYS